MSTANYGYMILAFLDIDPELIVHENVPIEEKELDLISISLGIYLSLVFSQGKGSNPQPGLYGPLPWAELPDQTFLIFAFFIHDPSVLDPRVREEGVITYAVIVLPKDEDQLIQARIGLERSLSIIDINDFENKLQIKNNLVITDLHKGIINNSATIMSILTINNHFVGFYRISEQNKMILIQIAKFVEEDEIISIFNQITRAMPLLQQFFFENIN